MKPNLPLPFPLSLRFVSPPPHPPPPPLHHPQKFHWPPQDDGQIAKLAMNWSSKERDAARRIQQFLRKSLEQKKAQKKKDRAASKIQALVRGFLARRRLKRALHAAVVIQAHVRGFLVRRRYSGLFERR